MKNRTTQYQSSSGSSGELGRVSPPCRYETLDLLRGIAALVVCFYHMGGLLVPEWKFFPSGYLCVDLFFLLSGFVIAANYDRKITNGFSFRSFFEARIARLYPLFIVATLLGFLVFHAKQYNDTGTFGWGSSLWNLVANVAVLPSLLGHEGPIFQFNGPCWSIFFELGVNVVFFMTWRKLTSVGLSVLIGAGAIGLIACACAFSKINGGVTTDSFWQGFPRVIFSFFLGVAIFRAGLSDRVKAGRSALGPLIVLLLVALNARAWLPACWYAASDLVLVLFIFPGVLVFMASIDLSPRWSKGAEILGGASYSVYLLQDPLANILAGLSLVLFGRNILSLAPYAGLVFFPLILISSYYIWRWFEIPAKNRLLKLWKR